MSNRPTEHTVAKAEQEKLLNEARKYWLEYCRDKNAPNLPPLQVCFLAGFVACADLVGDLLVEAAGDDDAKDEMFTPVALRLMIASAGAAIDAGGDSKEILDDIKAAFSEVNETLEERKSN